MDDALRVAVAPEGIGPRTAVVAMFLASASVPLYIHLPRFAAETGLSLATVGAVLLAIRVLDCVQDPVLGWLGQRLEARRRHMAAAAFLSLGLGFFWLFALQPGLPAFVLALAIISTAFSLGTILFYSQCVANAAPGGAREHYRLAGWRETGTLAGILVAALLPQIGILWLGTPQGYALLGATILFSAPLVLWVAVPLWRRPVIAQEGLSFQPLLAGRPRELLILALVNALPVATTATLFLFFVEDRLGLPDLAAVFLLLFFLAAGASAAMWSRLAERFGPRRVLVGAMLLAILSFAWTALLPAGAAVAFAVICIASGAALGADMVILPALFSATLAGAHLPAALGFGAWNFANKLALALAAGLLLPVLQVAGYAPGGDNSEQVLSVLTITYAVVPLLLKLPALLMVLRLPDGDMP